MDEKDLLRNEDLWAGQSLQRWPLLHSVYFYFKNSYSTFHVPGTVLSASFTYNDPLKQNLLSAHFADEETRAQRYYVIFPKSWLLSGRVGI